MNFIEGGDVSLAFEGDIGAAFQFARENSSDGEAIYLAGISLAQLLMFNNTEHARAISSATIRHNQAKETPLAIYIALVIYAETRKITLIDKFHQLGLCISYDRVL